MIGKRRRVPQVKDDDVEGLLVEGRAYRPRDVAGQAPSSGGATGALLGRLPFGRGSLCRLFLRLFFCLHQSCSPFESSVYKRCRRIWVSTAAGTRPVMLSPARRRARMPVDETSGVAASTR